MAGEAVMTQLDKLTWRELEEDRLECYKSISESLTESTLDELQAKDLKKKIDDILKVLLLDIASERADVAQPALQILGYILLLAATAENESLLSAVSQSDILDKLLKVVMITGDKQICTRSLWCLSKQNFIKTILVDKIDKVLEVLIHAQCSKKFQSMTVEHESINFLIRFLEQIPEELEARADKWGKLLYPHLVHSAPKVRERAFFAMEMALPMLLPHREVIAKQLAADLKTLLLSDLKKLMITGQELYALDVWKIYVQLLGKLLHHGSLINSMLPITEQGFKNTKPVVKCASYMAWQVLIDNFALTHEIVSDQKRVKLIMQVFKINNTKTEAIAMEKLTVWWHFVVQLASKASFYFEQVIVPLLQYIVGGGYLQVTVTKPGTPVAITPVHRKGQPSPSTPNINVKGGTPGGNLGGFESVMLKGFEVLARLTGCAADDIKGYKFSIAELKPEVITGISFYQKNASIFISTFKLLAESGVQINEEMLFQTWCSLVAHTKNSLEHGTKKDSLDVFTSLVTCYQELVASQQLSSGLLLKMMDALLCLPAKILGSPAYSISGSRDQMMQGCPALVLVEMLFHDRILETQAASGEEKFFVLLEKLVQIVLSTPSNALQSCDTMLQLVEKATSSIDNKESLWRMWSAIVNPLQQQITQMNEVNQGDALEYNFSCLTQALTLPIVHVLSGDLPQGTLKSMMKTWTEIYSTFSRLAAMVSNAEANIACEVVCDKIVASKIGFKNSPIHIDALAQAVLAMTEKVDFSSLSNNFGFLGAYSPSQFGKKKTTTCKSLGNINALVTLLGQIINGLHTTGQMDSQDLKKLTTMTALQTVALNLIQVTSSLFNHLPTSQMIYSVTSRLTDPLSTMFGDSSHSGNKIYSSQVLHKLDKMWMDIVTSLQSRFNGPYDQDFLVEFSPFLQTTFLHPRRSIKNQTLILWNSTFAKTNSLEYPDTLKPVLKEVRHKTASIILPGWAASDIIEETQVSQMTQGDSQQQVTIPPNIIGFQSPVKNMGSFLNKSVSPNVKNSPLRKSPASKKAVRSLSDMKDDDFVVISNLPKKKRVLTVHQREVMKERTVLPAMYNNLDVSQDRSLMSQFLSTDSQMSQMSTPTPTSDMTIAPFPFILPDKPVDKSKIVKEANQQSVKSEVPEKSDADNDAKPAEKKEPKTRRRSVRFKDDKNSEDDSSSQEQEKPEIVEKDKTKESSKESAPGKAVTESEIVVIGSETQDFSDKDSDKDPIVIDSQTQDFNKTNVDVTKDEPMEGSETQNTNCSESDNSVFKEESSATDQLEKKVSSEPDVEGTPRRSSRRNTSAGDSENSAKRNISEKDLTDKSSLSSQQSSQSGSEASESLDVKPNIKSGSPMKKRRGRPKKTLSPERCNSITKYLNKSPMKSVPLKAEPVKSEPVKPEPVTLVEETQFMPEESPISQEISTTNVSVVETPVKDDEVELDKGDVEEASMNLIEKLNPLKKVEECISANADVTMELADKSSSRKPIVQLERLSPNDIEKHQRVLRNRPESDSDSSITEKSGKENKARSSQLKRRNSMLKFSRAAKANQEAPQSEDDRQSPIPAVNMDDIVPCSQDPFEFQKKMAQVVKESKDKEDKTSPSESIEDPVDPDDTKVEEEEDMEVDGKVEAIPETELAGDGKGESVSKADQQSESNDLNAKGNPDIVPLNSSEIDESDNSQQTIVALKGRSFKSDSGDDTESSQNSQTDSDPNALRPKRIRTPKKNFWECNGDIESHQLSPLCKHIESEQSDSSQKIKKKRGRPKRLQNTLDESVDTEQKLFQPTVDEKVLSSSEEIHENSKPEVNGEIEKELDEIVNKECNLDTESDEDANSDVPLSVMKNNLDVSADDIPLSELVTDTFPSKSANTDNASSEGKDSINGDTGSPNGQLQDRRRSLSRKRRRGVKRRHSNEKNETVKHTGDKVEAGDAVMSEKEVAVSDEKEPAVNGLNEEPHKSERQAECETEVGAKTKKETAEKTEDVNKPIAEAEVKSSPRKTVLTGKGPSPPKKGKPFDIPETPTSTNKKFVSRASYILEQARKISISKAFPSPSSLQHRKRFTGIKSSPRMIRPFPGGILKARAANDNTGSPPQNRLMSSSPSFRPVNLPRVYSPSASPSAGILKRRRLTEDIAVDSPSPPCKQRRVCFNEELDVCLASPNASPSKPVNRCLELAKGQQGQNPSPNSSKNKLAKRTESKNDNFAVPKNITRPKDSQQMSMSQASVSCTQESQLNGTDPICPKLMDCEVPVEQVLPQLTSSTWVRGLSKFVRSRNIKTVGDLSSLTECEIHNLPLRSPRVQTVRDVLGAFTNKGKSSSSKEIPVLNVPEPSSPSKLPNVDDELDRMSPVKGDLDTSIDSEDEQHLQLDATNSEDAMAGQEAAVTAEVTPTAKTEITNDTEHASSLESDVSALKLVEDFTNRMNEDLLSRTSRRDMLQMYNKLNDTVASIVAAMMDKCPASPVDSSKTQEDES